MVRIWTRRLDEAVIIYLDGPLTIGDWDLSLRRKVRDLMACGHVCIVLNCERARYIDSFGFKELGQVAAMIKRDGGNAVVAGINWRFQWMANELSRSLPVFRSEAEAIANFKT